MEGYYKKFSRCVCVFVFNKLVQLVQFIYVQWSKVGGVFFLLLKGHELVSSSLN